MRDVAKEVPERSEGHSGISVDAQRLEYPKYVIGQQRPDPLLMFLSRKRRELIRPPRVEMNTDTSEALAKELTELKELLVHRDVAVRDGTMKKLQESPRLYEILPNLAAMAEKERSAELTEAIRKIAKPIGKGALFHKLIADVDAVQSESNSILREAGDKQLSELDEEPMANAVQAILTRIKAVVDAADGIQNHERRVLARLLNTPDRRKPLASDVMNRIEGVPFHSRLTTSRALIVLAEELKHAKKSQSTIDLLQEEAISSFKESLELTIDGLYNQFLCDIWSEALRSLRKLNPARFDRLFTDKASLGTPD